MILNRNECAKIFAQGCNAILWRGRRIINKYVDWEYYKIFYYVAKYRNFTSRAGAGQQPAQYTHSMVRLESQPLCYPFVLFIA